MASKALSLTSLLLTLNLLFFTLVSSTNHCSCPPSAPTPKPISPPKPKSPLPPAPKPKKPPPSAPTPKPISPPKPKSPLPPAPKPKNPPPSTPKPISPAPPKKETCPIDALKLGVCANVLGGLIGVVVGTPAKEPCCSLLNGLVDLEAAVCLCTAIKANVLGINLNVPVDLSLLLNYCGKKVPTGFQCK